MPDGTVAAEEVDVVVVGAGVAGLYAIHKLRGQGLSLLCVEAGSGVGGTWFWNRYPGARCDVESIDYSYSFDPQLEQDWDWTERYATQPEILAYLEHVAERYDLLRSIRFEVRVTSAVLDETAGRWRVELDTGTEIDCRFVVFATGSLSSVRTPDIPGIQNFTGRILYTARWPHEQVDFTGRRAGLIGTGASGMQLTPIVAEQAAQLTVFQRTANYSVPAANRPHTPESQASYKAAYPERRRLSWLSGGGSPYSPYPKKTLEVDEQERREAYERQWQLGGVLFGKTFPDQTQNEEANAPAREFFGEKVRAMIDNPEVADRLIPRDHPIGAKRICTDSGYYPTFNRDNVSLVDLRETPIKEIEASGIRTTERLHKLDDLVLATGFDALTGALTAIDIRGHEGRELRDEWANGPRTYLGLGVAGFPNMFIITGPGSPSVLANMVLAGQHHVDWVADTITHLDAHGRWGIEPTPKAQESWVRYCAEMADGTLMGKANSWYVGANVPGKARVFMPFIGGFGRYREIVADVVADDYRGFELRDSSDGRSARTTPQATNAR